MFKFVSYFLAKENVEDIYLEALKIFNESILNVYDLDGLAKGNIEFMMNFKKF
ncbi:hypothetical protein PL321_07060 [Caloramator sp. mosi_1]|uniref:hypothetical protein n=1 Tax=Caloramator sp. mosi_1 TaxID=3023090 RepID=UPI0023629E32|nr:hypothetical protein [Caloramator sp. mosi_1]WDC85214.1 hypothetical protein PL321_07060 [Caloramator sp. mosi_1]